jgi:hypothetical protein
LAAAAKSGCWASQFELAVQESWFGDASSPQETSNILTYHAKDVFLDVKVLYLNVGRDLFSYHFDWLLYTVLQLGKNVETLRLSPDLFYDEYYWDGPNFCGDFIQSIQLNCLRKIEFDQAVCQQSDLVSLLKRHKDTMRELRASEFGLLGSWKQVMIWIYEEIQTDVGGDQAQQGHTIWMLEALSVVDAQGTRSGEVAYQSSTYNLSTPSCIQRPLQTYRAVLANPTSYASPGKEKRTC